MANYTDTENGARCTYHLWRYDLEGAGWLDWTHARQLLRVERRAETPPTGERTVGNRYYVTSLAPDELGSKAALSTPRAHWRCELETHWTADAELGEDRRQRPARGPSTLWRNRRANAPAAPVAPPAPPAPRVVTPRAPGGPPPRQPARQVRAGAWCRRVARGATTRGFARHAARTASRAVRADFSPEEHK